MADLARGAGGQVRAEGRRLRAATRRLHSTMSEIVEQATGAPLSTQPYTRYLRGKYAELYAL